jgi:[ribosomal protein S5]-alanine N-acetyltransferase
MHLVAPDAPFEDGVVELRPIDERDLATIEAAASDRDIARRFALERLSAQEYLDAYREALHGGSAAAFAICDARATSVGQVLVELRDAGRADVGYWLLAEARGGGRATRALRLVSRWALSQPGVVRLQLWTVPDNVASQRVADRAGFQREGVLRSYGEVGGRRVDAVFYSLLPSDLD